MATVAALPGVRSVRLHPAHDTSLDAFAVRVLADRRAAADERTTGDAAVRVAAAVQVGGAARVLELRIDPRPPRGRRSARGSPPPGSWRSASPPSPAPGCSSRVAGSACGTGWRCSRR
jgi:hypothetical protein